MRNRTVQWMENKILAILTKQSIVKSYLALSALTLDFNVRSLEEQHNLDIAIEYLLSKNMIIRYRAEGMTNYKLNAA